MHVSSYHNDYALWIETMLQSIGVNQHENNAQICKTNCDIDIVLNTMRSIVGKPSWMVPSSWLIACLQNDLCKLA